MKALVLAAGKATSLLPFSRSRTAPMVKLCGRFMIEHALELLREAGVGDVVVVTNPESDSVARALGDGGRLGVSIEVAVQRSPGIGGAILSAEEHLRSGEHFLLVYGDTLTRDNLAVLALQAHHEHQGPTAAVCLTEHPERYGNIYMSGEMRITKIVERPETALGNYVLAGLFVLPRSFFGYLRESDGKMYAAMDRLITEQTLHAAIWERDWADLRYPWDILAANRILMQGWNRAEIAASADVSDLASISGPVRIGDNVRIMAGAVVQGPCYIGADSFIGNNVLVRAYTSIGARSVIGFGVELKNSVLMDRSRVGRLSFIGDSVVGEDVDIGAGTMTINREIDDQAIAVATGRKRVSTHLRKLGAFIGDRAVLGAGHSLAPGCIVDQGQVVPNRTSYPTEDA